MWWVPWVNLTENHCNTHWITFAIVFHKSSNIWKTTHNSNYVPARIEPLTNKWYEIIMRWIVNGCLIYCCWLCFVFATLWWSNHMLAKMPPHCGTVELIMWLVTEPAKKTNGQIEWKPSWRPTAKRYVLNNNIAAALHSIARHNIAASFCRELML